MNGNRVDSPDDGRNLVGTVTASGNSVMLSIVRDGSERDAVVAPKEEDDNERITPLGSPGVVLRIGGPLDQPLFRSSNRIQQAAIEINIRNPAAAYLEFLGAKLEDEQTHSQNAARFGWVDLYSTTASLDDWDHFEGLYTLGVECHVAANPNEPDSPQLLQRSRRWRSGEFTQSFQK